MSATTLVVTTEQEKYRDDFIRELANLVGCEPNSLPTTCTKQIACEFLGLINHKTLDVWRCNGRHGIVMLKDFKRILRLNAPSITHQPKMIFQPES